MDFKGGSFEYEFATKGDKIFLQLIVNTFLLPCLTKLFLNG